MGATMVKNIVLAVLFAAIIRQVFTPLLAKNQRNKRYTKENRTGNNDTQNH